MKITNQTTKNAIKAQIMMANFTMAEVVDALSMEYGWSDSLSNFSAKLGRGSGTHDFGISLCFFFLPVHPLICTGKIKGYWKREINASLNVTSLSKSDGRNRELGVELSKEQIETME